jgi:hypothetical protein
MIAFLSGIHFSSPVFSAYSANSAIPIGNASTGIIIAHGGIKTEPWANVRALGAECAAEEMGFEESEEGEGLCV